MIVLLKVFGFCTNLYAVTVLSRFVSLLFAHFLSKTVMIAALSPADINYDETLGTLRLGIVTSLLWQFLWWGVILHVSEWPLTVCPCTGASYEYLVFCVYTIHIQCNCIMCNPNTSSMGYKYVSYDTRVGFWPRTKTYICGVQITSLKTQDSYMHWNWLWVLCRDWVICRDRVLPRCGPYVVCLRQLY